MSSFDPVTLVVAPTPRMLEQIRFHLNLPDATYILMGSSVPAVRAEAVYVFGATAFRHHAEASNRANWDKRGEWLQHLRSRLIPDGKWIEI